MVDAFSDKKIREQLHRELPVVHPSLVVIRAPRLVKLEHHVGLVFLVRV